MSALPTLAPDLCQPYKLIKRRYQCKPAWLWRMATLFRQKLKLLSQKSILLLKLVKHEVHLKEGKKIPHLKSLKASNIALKLPSPKQCTWRRKSCHPENVIISSICSLKLDAHLTRNHWAKTYLSIWAGELHFSPSIPWCHTSSATNQQRTAFKILRICMHFREEAQRY